MRWLAGLTLLALTTVVRAELDPALEQFLLQADVEVPNDPYRGEINIPGDGCISPKEMAYHPLIYGPGPSVPNPEPKVANCVVGWVYKDLQFYKDIKGIHPGPNLCREQLEKTNYQYIADAIARYTQTCLAEDETFVYALMTGTSDSH